jgi:hypothetical protein
MPSTQHQSQPTGRGPDRRRWWGAVVASLAAAGWAANDGAQVSAGAQGAASAAQMAGVADGEPVELGIYLYSAESAAAQSSVERGEIGSAEHQAELVVEHLNASGGILGHPVEAVIYEGDLARGSDINDQEACALFTQDHNVVAVASNLPNGTNEVMLQCLSELNIPLFEANLTAYPDWTTEAYARYPLFAHTGLSWDRLVDPFVDHLVAAEYFTSWDTENGGPGSAEVKIGILAPDFPRAHEVVAELIAPALERHGLAIEADAYPVAPGDYPNVMLRFRDAGITHVISVGAGASLQFPPVAEGQQYRPRYAVTTKNWPLGQSGGMAPAAQLVGALGVGWAPLADVPPAQRSEESPREAECMTLMTEGGEDMSDDTTRVGAANVCEAAFLLRDAFDAGGGLTSEDWLAGLESLGSVDSVQTLGVSFGPDQHDAVAVVRGLAFSEECTCFEYTTEIEL